MHTNVVSFPLPSVCFLATIERRVVIAWNFLLKTIVGRCCLVRAADGHGHPRATCHAHCGNGSRRGRRQNGGGHGPWRLPEAQGSGAGARSYDDAGGDGIGQADLPEEGLPVRACIRW